MLRALKRLVMLVGLAIVLPLLASLGGVTVHGQAQTSTHSSG